MSEKRYTVVYVEFLMNQIGYEIQPKRLFMVNSSVFFSSKIFSKFG